MRIALDATPLTVPTGGIRRYTEELCPALAGQFPGDDFLLLSDQPVGQIEARRHNLRVVRGYSGRWWLLGLPRELIARRIGLFHGTDFAVPYLPVLPSVLTLHDLSPWLDPAWPPAGGRVRRRTPYLVGLNIATVILVPSEAIRRQAAEYFRLSPRRIVSVPLAAPDRFQPVPGPPPARAYFLCVATLGPRKNLAVLIEAWREVARHWPVELWIAGRAADPRCVPAPEPGLRLLGQVPDQDLPGLYSRALAFVYPSLYEGFALPVLEAMQCGAAVLASRDPAISEVSGGAAVLLDPRDPKAWVAGMMMAFIRPEWLADLRERSLCQARQFSWAKTARLTREVYAEAVRRFGE